MDPLLEPYLGPIGEPVWGETPALSIADLRGRFPNLRPHASQAELARAAHAAAVHSSRYNKVDFESNDISLDVDGVAERGWRSVYFICPLTEQRTKILYFVEGWLISRAAYRSPAIRTTLLQRSHRRLLIHYLLDARAYLAMEVIEAMADKLGQLIEGQDDPLAQQAIEIAADASQQRKMRRAALEGRDERRAARQARKRRQAREQKAALKADTLGIWAALRRTEGAGHVVALQRTQGLGLEPDGFVTEVRPQDFDILEAPLEPLADHLHIDIRLLRKEPSCWRSGQLTVFPLTEGVLVGVDLRSGAAPEMRVAFAFEGRRRLQRIELAMRAIGGRVRPLFCCPSGEQVEVLAFRGGRFASVGAQRLLRPSEVARRATRSSTRAG